MGIVAGLTVMALLLIGAVTGSIRFFVAGGRSERPKPADAFPQLGTAQNGVLRGERVSFRYPKRWQVQHHGGMQAAGSSTGVTVLGLEAGDEVAVETMPLLLPVRNPKDFDEFAAEIGQLMQQHERTTNDRIVGGPIDSTLGGYPAVEYLLQGPGPGGLVAGQRIVVSAHGMTEYWITCFSTQRHAADVQKGCDQIVQTFKIS